MISTRIIQRICFVFLFTVQFVCITYAGQETSSESGYKIGYHAENGLSFVHVALNNEERVRTASAYEENCANFIDDDNDNLVDCNDTDDCMNEIVCKGCQNEMDCPGYKGQSQNGFGPIEICDDNYDNDWNGLADCKDTEACADSPACRETDCADGKDNDGDYKIDYADEDCVKSEECIEEEKESELCSNNIDDDCDGLTDCADSGCSKLISCMSAPLSVEDCSNMQDDNKNGLIDCMDSDCSGVLSDGDVCPPLLMENCSNVYADDDNDGAQGCMDADCFWHSACDGLAPYLVDKSHEFNCSDNEDNDKDGSIDCADDDCKGKENCMEDCSNPDNDHDHDGDIAAVDTDCASIYAKIEKDICVYGLGAIEINSIQMNVNSISSENTAIIQMKNGNYYFAALDDSNNIESTLSIIEYAIAGKEMRLSESYENCGNASIFISMQEGGIIYFYIITEDKWLLFSKPLANETVEKQLSLIDFGLGDNPCSLNRTQYCFTEASCVEAGGYWSVKNNACNKSITSEDCESDEILLENDCAKISVAFERLKEQDGFYETMVNYLNSVKNTGTADPVYSAAQEIFKTSCPGLTCTPSPELCPENYTPITQCASLVSCSDLKNCAEIDSFTCPECPVCQNCPVCQTCEVCATCPACNSCCGGDNTNGGDN